MFYYPGGYDLIVNIVNALWWNMRLSLSLSLSVCCIGPSHHRDLTMAPSVYISEVGEMWFTVIICIRNPYSETSSKLNHNSQYIHNYVHVQSFYDKSIHSARHSTAKRILCDLYCRISNQKLHLLFHSWLHWCHLKGYTVANTVISIHFTPGIIQKSLSHFGKFNLSSYYVIWFVWNYCFSLHHPRPSSWPIAKSYRWKPMKIVLPIVFFATCLFHSVKCILHVGGDGHVAEVIPNKLNKQQKCNR